MRSIRTVCLISLLLLPVLSSYGDQTHEYRDCTTLRMRTCGYANLDTTLKVLVLQCEILYIYVCLEKRYSSGYLIGINLLKLTIDINISIFRTRYNLTSLNIFNNRFLDGTVWVIVNTCVHWRWRRRGLPWENPSCSTMAGYFEKHFSW